MLIYLTFRIISSTAAFLYPGYASYKTLSQRPASEEDLERWLMYWSVLGCIVGVEYVAEWLISWLPFYYLLKTLFLLYLSLPQTRGSSYIYINYLQPFLHYHEADIDATMSKLKARVYNYMQERLRLLWEAILGSLGQGSQPGATAASDSAQPPTVTDPVSGPAQLIGGLWRSYGPSLVASGASLFTAASVAAAAQRAQTNQRPAPNRSSENVEERRRRLEAELANLNNSSGSDEDMMTTNPGTTGYRPTRTGSSADIRSRGGQFEEVEVPSDVEGYDVGPSARDGPTAQGMSRTSSLFGWGWGGSGETKRAKEE